MANTDTKLSTVVTELRELDFKFKSGFYVDVVERGYGLKLVHAISIQNEILECEALKSLGDLYLHKAKMNKDKVENFNKACSMYIELLRFYTSTEEKQVVQHRIKYAEKCTKLVHDQESMKLSVRNSGNPTLALSMSLHEMEKKTRSMMPLIECYTKSFVKAIVGGNKSLEIESLKSLGDLYLENLKGRVGKDEAELNKPTGLYRAALDRCEEPDGRETLKHRIEYAEKVQTGYLNRAERKFALALKSVHLKDPNAGQHWKEAEPLCKLSDVYLKKGMLSNDGGDFTKAAALCNAAVARARAEDREGIKHTVPEITQSFVQHVLRIKQTVPIDDVEKHKSMLMDCRGYVAEEIKRIEQQIDPYSLDDDDPNILEVEKKRVEAVKALFDTIVHQRRTFIAGLVDECMEVMGPPPCKYAMIGLGSQATGLVTPYSDLEFAILIEKEKENNVKYFHNLTHYLHLKVINLGETILPTIAIKSLNDFESDKKLDNWFYDSVTPHGFSFDGAMPLACKTPLGRGKACHLIRTPRDMAKVLEDDVTFHLKKGYHLASVLGNVSLITGEQGLVNEYMVAWNEQLKTNEKKIARLVADAMLKENRETFERKDPTARILNVKKEIYRFSSLAVSCWALLCDIQPTTIWETIQNMHIQGAINDKNAHHLMVLVSISAELRLRTYMNNRGQVENMSVLSSMAANDDISKKTEKIFYVSNKKQLMRYYYTATPLKSFVSQLSNRQPLEEPSVLFDNSSILQANVYESMFDYKNSMKCIEQALQIEQSKHGKGAIHHDITVLLGSLGDALPNIGDNKSAVSHYEKSPQMLRSIYGENIANLNISLLLNNLGNAWSYLGDHRKAVSYYEQSLQMMRSIHGKNTAHPDIAGLLNNLGNAWKDLGDHKKAVSYYEQSLQMRWIIYGESTAHPDIASSLNNLGNAWNDLGDYRKAVSYHEQSLQMRRIIYGENTAHPDIADSLNNLGTTWSKLGDYRKAVSYHEQALQMKRIIYGESTAHPDIASSLNNLGTTWSELDDYRKAVSYLEQALQMRRIIYGERTAHPDIASSLYNLGNAWGLLGDYRKAVSYHEQALQMRRIIYAEYTAHPDIASSLNNLGGTWRKLDDHRKAVSYYEQALQMRRRIHGESTAHPDIASLLYNLGNAWGLLGDYRKAVSYHEQSLQMRKSIYGESTAHPDIAKSHNSLGAVWVKFGDLRKAVNYFEQALQMKRRIHGERTAHPGIHQLLRVLCEAYEFLGDHKKAASYSAQATQMKQMLDETERP